MKKIVFVLILVVAFVSCKEKSTQQKIKQNKKVVQKKEFIIEINYKTNKEDFFKISLNNIKVDTYQKKNIQIIEKVSPTTDYDKITANYGENISNNIAINFGKNNPKKIELESIILKYGNNKQIVTLDNINKFFVLNKFVINDTIDKTLKTIKIGGASNPNLFLKSTVLKTLKKGS